MFSDVIEDWKPVGAAWREAVVKIKFSEGAGRESAVKLKFSEGVGQAGDEKRKIMRWGMLVYVQE
jgi:hypothetical protein